MGYCKEREIKKGFLCFSEGVRPYGSFAVTEHVDIEMLDPEGTTFKKTTAIHIPKIVRRKGPRDASFTVRLPIILPKGATVRLGYHSSLDKALSCK